MRHLLVGGLLAISALSVGCGATSSVSVGSTNLVVHPQPTLIVNLNCRGLCVDGVRKPDEEVSACLKRVHYDVFGLQRYHFENQHYLDGQRLSFCLGAIEDMMRAQPMEIPTYNCQLLQNRDSIEVMPKVWEAQCATFPDSWWCAHDFSLKPPYYGFVVPAYVGKGCPPIPDAYREQSE
jgi:hypothetical protein